VKEHPKLENIPLASGVFFYVPGLCYSLYIDFSELNPSGDYLKISIKSYFL